MKKEKYLSEFMDSFIGDMESGKRLKFRSSCRVSDGYITNIRSAWVRLKEFEKQQGCSYRLDEVDMSFRRDFVGFLVRKGLKPNTIKTRMAAIHVAMREAYISGLTRNEGFSDPDFIPLAESVDSVYLTNEQIISLKNLDLTKWSGKIRGIKLYPQMLRVLEWTRDLFLVGCMTGQRFSDYSRINSSMVTLICGYKFIKLKQKKTGAEVIIPVERTFENILEKYKGQMPHVALATFNRNMRILGEMMGWTHTPDGGNRFCDMLSSHTARRSFATNAYQRGVPIKSIMAITGHRSERSLRLYLRLDTRDKALMAARDFNGFLEIAAR